METKKSKISTEKTEKQCKHCKKPFLTARPSRHYCSTACKLKSQPKAKRKPKSNQFSIVINIEQNKGWFSRLMSWIFRNKKKKEELKP